MSTDEIVEVVSDLRARLAGAEAGRDAWKAYAERLTAALGALVIDEDDDHAGVYWDGEEGVDDYVCVYCALFPHALNCPIVLALVLLAETPKGETP